MAVSYGIMYFQGDLTPNTVGHACYFTHLFLYNRGKTSRSG